jgi:hypothetical protein
MRKIPLLVALALVAATSAAQSKPRLSGEERVAREIEGRIAGEPVDCIPLHQVHSSRIIDDEAIVFDAGSTIYVNRPRGGRQSLDQWDVLVTRPFGSTLCNTDVVRLYDATARMETGIVFLGDFIPYRRERRGR